MRRKGLVVAFLWLGSSLIGWAQSDAPRNVILMIGDGMGVAAIGQLAAATGDRVFSRFPRGGLVLTWPLDEETWVTDSGASATAMATGEKTRNHLLSLRPNAQGTLDTLETVLELAERLGKATGIVVACQVTHATPAAFFAHADRGNELGIAAQLVESGVDVVLGGGTSFFLPADSSGGKRQDGRDLLAELRNRGYRVITDTSELRGLDLSKEAKVIGLFAPVALPAAVERKLRLAELVDCALRCLSKHPSGFFLMVEGSQIDWAAHANNAEHELAEMRDFAEAIRVALDFASRDGKTLLIVTADHETGGMAITGGSPKEARVEVGYLVGNHTADPVPFFAYGPGSERLPALLENDYIGRVLKDLVRGR
ncbi:MAG: alkaline phosphatase [candidate division KSB1 bacterium]|nr:alkaline phosphatase [candidate division KSB1 bacterium]